MFTVTPHKHYIIDLTKLFESKVIDSSFFPKYNTLYNIFQSLDRLKWVNGLSCKILKFLWNCHESIVSIGQRVKSWENTTFYFSILFVHSLLPFSTTVLVSGCHFFFRVRGSFSWQLCGRYRRNLLLKWFFRALV